MGGAGPYVEFEPDRSGWIVPSGLSLLSDVEISAAYLRAHPFFLERVADLRADSESGWEDFLEEEKDASVAFPELIVSMKRSLTRTDRALAQNLNSDLKSRPHAFALVLPRHFSSFLDRSSPHFKTWNMCFGGVLAKRPSWNETSKMYVNDTEPIADIFYMLQCIAPGMLQLIRREDFDEYGEDETIRSTPMLEWMSANKGALKMILGSEERIEELMKVSTSCYYARFSSSYDEHDEGPGNDFSACSAEDCGWCGNCHY